MTKFPTQQARRHPGAGRGPVSFNETPQRRWIPAFAGMTQFRRIPTFAGMTKFRTQQARRHPGAGRGPVSFNETPQRRWIAAFAGMTKFRTQQARRHPGAGRGPVSFNETPQRHWIPAFAGMTQFRRIPAFAGMTKFRTQQARRHPGAGRGPVSFSGTPQRHWIPAFAGMTGAPPRSSEQRGFTLLELMLAMALTALLLGMLSAGVYTVVNDWQDDTGKLDATLEKSLVVLQLERALLGSFPHSYVGDDLARHVYFVGEDDALSFVSAVSPQRRPGLTAWQLESDNEGLQLKLTPAFADDPETRFENLDPTLLLPGYRARFRYLLQRNPDEKEWLDEWDGAVQQSLPLAVHVVLTRVDAERDEEPLEIVAPIRAWQHAELQPVVPVN
jgi:general secretion pathway protein J